MKFLVLALLSLLTFLTNDPPSIIIHDDSAYVEINHVYREDIDGNIEKRMIQIIWWEWRDEILLPEKDTLGRDTGDWKTSSSFVVKDFRVTWSSHSRPQQTRNITPRRKNRKYICLFYDKDNRVFREVESGWLVVTHTYNDREVDNRNILSIENRNKLTKPPK